MRLIDADKVPPLSDLSGCVYEGGEYLAYKSGAEYGRGLVDDTPTIDPESLRPTAEWIEAPDEGADGSWEACFAVHGNPDGQHHSTNIARIVARGALNEISHNYL